MFQCKVVGGSWSQPPRSSPHALLVPTKLAKPENNQVLLQQAAVTLRTNLTKIPIRTCRQCSVIIESVTSALGLDLLRLYGLVRLYVYCWDWKEDLSGFVR